MRILLITALVLLLISSAPSAMAEGEAADEEIGPTCPLAMHYCRPIYELYLEAVDTIDAILHDE